MTRKALELFGCICRDGTITGGNTLHSPREITVEGDWSNGAYFLAANALGSAVSVRNLSESSSQGDKTVTQPLKKLKEHCVISAADIPDLIPILAVAAACSHGAVFTDVQRLRLKESDRVASVIHMITGLGGKAKATNTTLIVYETGLTGGMVHSAADHRIAMSAAIAATACKKPVILKDAQCVEKSYPQFFAEYRRFGGQYEQYLR